MLLSDEQWNTHPKRQQPQPNIPSGSLSAHEGQELARHPRAHWEGHTYPGLTLGLGWASTRARCSCLAQSGSEDGVPSLSQTPSQLWLVRLM